MLNEDARVTPADAVRYFGLAGIPVTRFMVHQWIKRAAERGEPIPVQDENGPRGAKRYRIGDLLEAEKAARARDTGRGRARNLAA